MSHRILVKNVQQMYELSQHDGGNYLLSVMCGGIAMFEVSIRLSTDEILAYQRDGVSFLDRLALTLGKETNAFTHRFV